MKATIKALLLVWIVALAATPLIAQPIQGRGEGRGEGHGPKGPDGPFGRCLQVLNLTDQQQADIKAATEASAAVLRPLHEQLRADHQALKALFDANSTDSCAIGAAMLKIRATEKAIQTETDALKAKILSYLTAEQKTKLEGCLAAPRGDKPRP